MKVRLIYPSFRHGSPPRAIAIAEARETKTQYVVRSDDVEFLENTGNVRFGSKEVRFRKKDGRKVGQIGYFIRTWYCAGPV